MQKLAKFGVLSFAKHLGVLYALFGLLASCIGVLVGCAEMLAGDMESAIGSFVLAVLAPFLYEVLGFVFAALFAWLYNLIAAKLGGIEIELR